MERFSQIYRNPYYALPGYKQTYDEEETARSNQHGQTAEQWQPLKNSLRRVQRDGLQKALLLQRVLNIATEGPPVGQGVETEGSGTKSADSQLTADIGKV
jgi:hypothetical protein